MKSEKLAIGQIFSHKRISERENIVIERISDITVYAKEVESGRDVLVSKKSFLSMYKEVK